MSAIQPPEPQKFMCGICLEDYLLGKESHTCNEEKAKKLAELRSRYLEQRANRDT